MRVLFALFVMIAAAAAADDDVSPTSPDPVQFEYRILPPEVGSSDVRAKGDSVSFEFYYVDIDCGTDYEYRFEKKDSLLTVRRALLDRSRCAADEDVLCAVQGTISGLAKGKYLFLFEAENLKGITKLHSEIVRIR